MATRTGILAHQDFNDDKKDAGEIGAGHTVTRHQIPPGEPIDGGTIDPLKYQDCPKASDAARTDELMTVKLALQAARRQHQSAHFDGRARTQRIDDTESTAAVAQFGMLLRRSELKVIRRGRRLKSGDASAGRIRMVIAPSSSG